MKTYYEPKPLFMERIKLLLKDEKDVKEFFESAKTQPRKSIRANTLKISSENLVKRLKNKGWNISQPFPYHPEIIQIISELQPGELGKTQEHLLGYYYVQEITSMMPILALSPKENDILLDLCAAPGSKTTQSAAQMKNKGTIIANDLNIGRISILSANLERLGVTNTIITRHDGLELCAKLKTKENSNKFSGPRKLKIFAESKTKIKFDKILVDAPCSGEGNLRTSPRTLLEWSEPMLKRFGARDKKLASTALTLLKTGGEMLYSTCTYAPEENEEVIQYLLDNYDIEIQNINLPIKTREGLSDWNNIKFSKEIKKCARIYHHDNNMEGFFLCKIKKLSEKIKEENKT